MHIPLKNHSRKELVPLRLVEDIKRAHERSHHNERSDRGHEFEAIHAFHPFSGRIPKHDPASEHPRRIRDEQPVRGLIRLFRMLHELPSRPVVRGQRRGEAVPVVVVQVKHACGIDSPYMQAG